MSPATRERRCGWRDRTERRLASLVPETIAQLERHRLATLARDLGEQADALCAPDLASRLIEVGCRWAPPEEVSGGQQPSPGDELGTGAVSRTSGTRRDAAHADAGSARRSYERVATATLALRLGSNLAVQQREVAYGFAADAATQELTFRLAHVALTDRLAAGALAALRAAIEATPPTHREDILTREAGSLLQHWCRRESSQRFRAVEAFGLLVDSFPHLALSRAHDEFANVDESDGDFVRRSFFLRHLRRHPAGPEMWIGHVRRHDPSEMVRQTLAGLLLDQIQEQAESATELWTHFAYTLDPDKEASERVRAFAARAACRSLLATPRNRLCEMVSGCLRDPALLVRQVCCETLRSGALRLAQESETPAQERVAGRLLQIIVARRNEASLAADEAAALADASEALYLLGKPEQRRLYKRLADALAGAPIGSRCRIGRPGDGDQQAQGRVLAAVSQDDIDLFAERRPTNILVRRGTRRAIRFWRVVHELSHPRAGKRCDVAHTQAAGARESIRAPARLLGSASETQLVGERRTVPSEGSWARHLPLPADLLDLGILRGRAAALYSSRGVTRLRPPSTLIARLRLHWNVTRQLASLAELRDRSLAASGERRAAYAERLRDLGVELTFETYPLDIDGKPWHVRDPWASSCFAPLPQGQPSVTLPAAFSLPLLPALLDRLAEAFPELLAYLAEPTVNDVSQLVRFLAGAMVGGVIARSLAQWRADRALQRIPLTTGGWGTRGKSSLERLKAAMFAGFGYEVLCKTTGSTPALLYMPPWEAPTEIPVYRPGGRATIWEQRDVLAVAARLGVQVFTWECMAIRPGYARILANHWSKDSFTTLTNTYPDHESRQGPGAEEVARSLLSVGRPGTTLVTAEQSMLPVIIAEAEARGIRVVNVPVYDDALIAEDLMGLFPHLEHRKNVALLRRFAKQLGFDADEATVEAARHAKPDVGALSEIGPITVGNHHISLVNAMAANDPVSTLESIRHVDTDGAAPVVVVANTRRDRPERTELFARILATQLPAIGRVVTGTDTVAFMRHFRRALRHESDAFAVSSASDARTLLDRVIRQVGMDKSDRSTVGDAICSTAGLGAPAATDAARRGSAAPRASILAHLSAESLAEARRLCQTTEAWSELGTLLVDSRLPLPMAERCKEAWLHANAREMVATTLRRLAREGRTSDEWLNLVRRFFVEAMERSTQVASPSVGSVVCGALHLAPAGRVIVLATQNIGGVGMQLLQSFGRAAALLDTREALSERDSARVGDARGGKPSERWDLLATAALLQKVTSMRPAGSDTPDMTFYRAALRRHLGAQHSWRMTLRRWLSESWGRTRSVLLAPIQRMRAALILYRFAGRRISAARAREQMLAIDAPALPARQLPGKRRPAWHPGRANDSGTVQPDSLSRRSRVSRPASG